jgi:heme-degrading monooxygenase HmoA
MKSFLLLVSLLFGSVHCFVVQSPTGASSVLVQQRHSHQQDRRHDPNNVLVRFSTITETEGIELTDKGLLKRDRYVAMNRFSVRKDKGPKFEQRWATRKSRLAQLQGFKYFHLMRRVILVNSDDCIYDEGTTEESSFENYMSFTIWNKKSDFSAWRNGDAFKEAHGGTSIGAFLSTMVNSAFVLRGPPKPAFYDGLLVQSTTTEQQSFQPQLVDGWRAVSADGVSTLPTESFIQLTKYYVPTGTAASDFEQYFTSVSTDMTTVPGFVASTLMRRDGQAKG